MKDKNRLRSIILTLIIMLLAGFSLYSKEMTSQSDAPTFQSELGDDTTTSQEASSDSRQYHFRTSELLESHYEKHGIEMGFIRTYFKPNDGRKYFDRT